MLHKYIFKLGMFFRNRLIPVYLNELLNTDMLERRDLESIQQERLSKLVKHAVKHSPYYSELFLKASINPDKVQSIHDLSNLPITTKAELIAHNSNIQNKIKGEKSFHSETSGSTGSPLVFYRNQSWDAWHNASVLRGYSWHEILPWERNGYLWGYNIAAVASKKIKFFDALQNRFRLFSYTDVDMEKFLRKLTKAKYLGGYSSMINELAKYVNNNPKLAGKFNLRMVKGTSEKILDSYQDATIKAFGQRIISEYGGAESGIIAFECANGHMHLNMETALIEVVENEILVTNLVSHSFPIIRYAMGDYVELDTNIQCECGRKSPVILSVTGRVGKKVVGYNQEYPSFVFYYIFKNLATVHGILLNYQVVQASKGKLHFRLENTLTESQRNLLNQEIKKYFSNDIDVSLSESEQLVTGDTKLKDFISHL